MLRIGIIIREFGLVGSKIEIFLTTVRKTGTFESNLQ
jgi:hypothetical protein